MKRMNRDGDIVSIGGIKIEKMSMRKSSREEIVPGTGIGIGTVTVTAAIGTRLATGMLLPMRTRTITGPLNLGPSSTMVMGAIIGHIGIGEIGIETGRGIDLVRGIRRVCMSDDVRCV